MDPMENVAEETIAEETEVCNEVTWSRREAARSRQIAIGKNRPEYKRYLSEVPPDRRDPAQPVTPDPRARVSKRQFDRALSDWRRRLHEFDAQPRSQPGGGAAGAAGVGSQTGGAKPPSLPLTRSGPGVAGSAGLSPQGAMGSTPGASGRRRGDRGVMRLRLAERLEPPMGPAASTPTPLNTQCSTPGPVTPAQKPRGALKYQDDATPTDVEKATPSLVTRFGGRPAPLQPPVKGKSLTETFNSIAQADMGTGHGGFARQDFKAGDKGNQGDVSLGSPRTPPPRGCRPPTSTSTSSTFVATPSSTPSGFGPRSWAHAARSPSSAVRTPHNVWVMDTPSPERFYQAPMRWAGGVELNQGSAGRLISASRLRVGDTVSARWYGDWHTAAVQAIHQDGMVDVVWAVGQEWSVSTLPATDVMPSVVGLPLPGAPLPGVDERLANCMVLPPVPDMSGC